MTDILATTGIGRAVDKDALIKIITKLIKKTAKILIFERKALTLQRKIKGVMLEWLKRHAWKACVRQKRTAGSNPACSAKEAPKFQLVNETSALPFYRK